tara:strand:- start:503 stop:637 length:135 start_codon:yes stop_codon:yes gene_type:complete
MGSGSTIDYGPAEYISGPFKLICFCDERTTGARGREFDVHAAVE